MVHEIRSRNSQKPFEVFISNKNHPSVKFVQVSFLDAGFQKFKRFRFTRFFVSLAHLRLALFP